MTHGHISVRIYAGLASAALIAWNVLSLLSFDFSILLVRGYLIVFGAVALSMEMNTCMCTRRCKKNVEEWAKILTRVWGRAIFYFFIATCQISFFPSMIDIILAANFLFLAIIMFLVGRHSSAKLNSFRERLHADNQDVDAKFAEFDQDNNGFISTDEFQTVASSVGIDLTVNELNATVQFLDENHDGHIDLFEFKKWYAMKTAARV